MIITRAPLRISYCGGGSDYSDFFEFSDGHVVGCSIDKYAYVFANELSPISQEKIRFTYRNTESVIDIGDLRHPTFREALKYFDLNEGWNFGTMSDLPSGVGLGGSSSFLVSLVKTLSQIKGKPITKEEIARISVAIERDVLEEPGGYQDQYHAAFGGFRHYGFSKEGVVMTEPLVSRKNLDLISNYQILVATGEQRSSSEFAKITRDSTAKHDFVKENSNIAQILARKLILNMDFENLYMNLSESVRLAWNLKTEFAQVDSVTLEMIHIGTSLGADAAKLCGAGGGGYVLFLGEPEVISRLRREFPAKHILDFRLTESGVEETLEFHD